MIPQNRLVWNGFPLFHVDRFGKEFSGSLYFVLGQGLGDHVNGFRILHELQGRFSGAQFIVYADKRWEELVLRMGRIEVRWYPTALDPRSGKGTNDPYVQAHETIRKEMTSHPEEAFLAYDHFPMPDRHARGETTLEAISRTIGLDFRGKARPFLPVDEKDGAFADRFLREKGLERGAFALLAPFSWPNKRWSRERFSLLIDALYQKHKLRSLLVAYPELGSFENPGVVMAYDLSLGQIGGLLSRSGLFVGLDSGPSHMAAAFDLPMVVIFVERHTIPFEVRALSPFALHVVEGFERQDREPPTETVCEAVSFVWQNRKNLKEEIPLCPACGRAAHYVMGAISEDLDFMCVCGMKIHSERREPKFPLSASQKESFLPVSHLITMPSFSAPIILSDMNSPSSLGDLEADLEKGDRETVEVRMDLEESGPVLSVNTGKGVSAPFFRWSQDALILWMRKQGFVLKWVEQKSEREDWIYRFVKDKDEMQEQGGNSPVRIPWSDGFLRLSNGSDYLRWYSFEKWGSFSDLVGIVKSLSALGYDREAVEVAWVAVRAKLSPRSLRWFGKALYYRVVRRQQTSCM